MTAQGQLFLDIAGVIDDQGTAIATLVEMLVEAGLVDEEEFWRRLVLWRARRDQEAAEGRLDEDG
jgi:hypothetical protein